MGGPSGGLILSGNTLYGMTANGSHAAGAGGSSVFAVNTDGTGLTILHNFVWTGVAGLILSGNTLYGTTESGYGTVFAVNTNGTGFTNLYSFTTPSGSGGYANYGTNSDGAAPAGGLILSGNTLYGTTLGGGSSGYGTVFAVNTDGTGFTNLYSFSAGSTNSSGVYTNSDGANPVGGLILSGNTLYGTASSGGSSDNGTVFAVNTDGTGFTNLYSFSALDPNTGTNNDGVNPVAGLILSGNTLYGTAPAGGSSGNGTVFAVNSDGTGFRVLYSFTAFPPGHYLNSDGANPVGGLILSGNTLYGTAQMGGTNASGTVFSIFIQPQLTLIPSGPYMILTWPTNYSGFTLQSTTNLGSSAVWSTNSSPPVVIGGENVVINTMSGGQQFYRLSSP
jgi:uncharacterized repeat protein (TIGR03803 family)